MQRAGLIYCWLCGCEHSVYIENGEEWFYDFRGWMLVDEEIEAERAFRFD